MAIVAGGNASPVLDAIDGPLDDIALPVEDLVISKEELAVSSWRDDGLRAALLQPLAQGSAVITFVGNDILGRRHEFEAALGRFEIIGVSRREQGYPGAARRWRLRGGFWWSGRRRYGQWPDAGPPFSASRTAMCSDDCRIDHQPIGRVLAAAQHRKDPFPDPAFGPAHEAIVDGLGRPILPRTMRPVTAR